MTPRTPSGEVAVTDAAVRSEERNRWITMGVVLLGTFMVILDTTIVNVALPSISSALDAGDGIEWIVTAYLLAVGVAQLPVGWLSDRVGRKRVFLVSLVLFGLGSLLSAASPTLGLLIAARVLQGLGGGAVMPVGMAMIYDVFPPERRGTALGIWGVAAMAAPAFGPVIGGYLVTYVSWHWLFLVNVPVCIVAVPAAAWLLHESAERDRRGFDRTGLALVSVGLVLLLITADRAGAWGWWSGRTITAMVVGAALLAAFVAWERVADQPVIDLDIFRVWVFDLTLVVVAVNITVQYTVLVFLSMELQLVHHLDALHTGFLLVPIAVAAAVTFPLGGWLTDRIGPRWPVVVGTAMLAASGLALGRFSTTTPGRTVVLVGLLQGLGNGFSMMPAAVTGLNSLPARFIARATAVRQLNQRVTAAFGIAIMATLFEQRRGPFPGASDAVQQSAFNTVFRVSAVFAGVAAVLALLLPGARRHRELVAERSAEVHGGHHDGHDLAVVVD